ncbi:MAG TPA: XRE family transcriptional regulator [Longimicrobiaceae bacterium]
MSETQTTAVRMGGFADSFFAEVRAVNVRQRQSMMTALIRVIECRRLGVPGTAALLGIDESRVRELLRGNIDAFTAEELVAMLAAVGIRV